MGLVLGAVSAVSKGPVVTAEGEGTIHVTVAGTRVTGPGPLVAVEGAAVFNATVAASSVNITQRPLAVGNGSMMVVRSLLRLHGSPVEGGASARLYLNHVAEWGSPPSECPDRVVLESPGPINYTLPGAGKPWSRVLGNYYEWINASDSDGDGAGDTPVRVGCLVDEHPLAVSPSSVSVLTPIMGAAVEPGYWPGDASGIPAVFYVVADGNVSGVESTIAGPVGGYAAADFIHWVDWDYSTMSLAGPAGEWQVTAHVPRDRHRPTVEARLEPQPGGNITITVSLWDNESGILYSCIAYRTMSGNSTVYATMATMKIRGVEESTTWNITIPRDALLNATRLEAVVCAVDAAANGNITRYSWRLEAAPPGPPPGGGSTTTSPNTTSMAGAATSTREQATSTGGATSSQETSGTQAPSPKAPGTSRGTGGPVGGERKRKLALDAIIVILAIVAVSLIVVLRRH